MSERSRKIEEAARALLDGSEGIKLNAGTAEVMNYWNRYRGLRAALRAALSLPPNTPALRSHRCIDDGGDGYECPGCHARADAPDDRFTNAVSTKEETHGSQYDLGEATGRAGMVRPDYERPRYGPGVVRGLCEDAVYGPGGKGSDRAGVSAEAGPGIAPDEYRRGLEAAAGMFPVGHDMRDRIMALAPTPLPTTNVAGRLTESTCPGTPLSSCYPPSSSSSESLTSTDGHDARSRRSAPDSTASAAPSDEYRRGIEDAAKFVSRWDLTRVFTRPWRDELTDAIRALVADAPDAGRGAFTMTMREIPHEPSPIEVEPPAPAPASECARCGRPVAPGMKALWGMKFCECGE